MTDEERHEANLRSEHASVRWQAQMEDFLRGVREANTMAKATGLPNSVRGSWATLAQANGLGALALAIANTGGDLEMAFSRLATAAEDAA